MFFFLCRESLDYSFHLIPVFRDLDTFPLQVSEYNTNNVGVLSFIDV